jgi:hypothetical protein
MQLAGDTLSKADKLKHCLALSPSSSLMLVALMFLSK